MLLGHLVALGHELLDEWVDLSWLNDSFLTPVLGEGFGGVNASLSGNFLSLDQVVNVLIESSPAWVPDESNLALLVDEDAKWDCLETEVGDRVAVWVLNVVVLDVFKSLLLDESLHLGLIGIDAEPDCSDLAVPLLAVCGHHLLSGRDGDMAVLAPGCPQLDQHDFIGLVADGAGGDFSSLRGSLDKAHFLTNLCSTENVGVDVKTLDGFLNVDNRSFALISLVVWEDSDNIELGDLLSFLVGQIHNVSVRYHWALEVFWVIDVIVSISKAGKDFALLLRIQISPLSSSSCLLSLATSASASTTTGSGWHASATSGTRWHSSCTCLSSALSWKHGWVQSLGKSLHPDLSCNCKSLGLRELSLWTVC